MLLLLYSCNKNREETDMQIIPIDISEAKPHIIDESKLIALETNDSSLIYEIGSLVEINDKWYIHSRDLIRIFDAKSGKYLGDLTKKGNGPGEYNSIRQFWNDGDTIRILDTDKKVVMDYLPSKGYIGNSHDFKDIYGKYDTNPTFLTPSTDGTGYYIINTWFGGSKESNPQFSFINLSNNEVKDIVGREMTDGFFFPDRMLTDHNKDRVLFWEQLRDTLFTLDREGVHALYVFDFGKERFPKEYQSYPDFIDRIMKFTEKNNDDLYVSLLKYFQVNGNDIYFSLAGTDESQYLARLNEKKLDVSLIKLVDKDNNYKQQAFFKVIGGKVLVSMIVKGESEKNPMVYLMSTEDF